MPTLEALEALKTQVNELGNEPRILSERGEALVDIAPPEPTVNPSLDALSDKEPVNGGVEEMEALLGSFNDETTDETEDFDLGDFGDLGEPVGTESPTGETITDVDAESVDDFLLDDLNFDEAMDESPEEPPGDEIVLDDAVFDADSEDFSLDDLDFDSDADDTPADIDDSDADIDDSDLSEEVEEDFSGDALPHDGEGQEELKNIGELGELGGIENYDEIPEDIDLGEGVGEETELPDMGTALEGLNELENLEGESQEELTLDDDLNFEEELGVDVLSDIREIDEDSQQFSMDDFGEQYNLVGSETALSDDLGLDIRELEQSLDEANEDGSEVFAISEDDFLAMQETLNTLPLNLKIAIEETLADERRTPEEIQPLIESLIIGEGPKSLVAWFQKITKRKIELPRNYEKRSGRVLERRREQLTYRLIKEGWPVLRIILVAISTTWLLGAAVFMWVYRPLKADTLYTRGLEAIAVDDVDEAVSLFYDAWDGWPLFAPPEGRDRIADAPIVVSGWKDKRRWLEYARAMRRRKHWNMAERFYEGYLTVKPNAKEIRMEYSAFLSGMLGKYDSAVRVLETAPDVAGNWDRDYTLAIGDVYLHWAEDDATKFEDARLRYAQTLERSRNDERAILSMMRYHVKVGDEDEILSLLPVFRNEIPGRTDQPALAAEVFSGLAEFHLARGNADESLRFVELAQNADPGAAEPSFAKAHYWRYVGDAGRELDAYQRTLINLATRESLDRNALRMRIMSLAGIGRINAGFAHRMSTDPRETAEIYSRAMSNYTKAVELYEDARSRNQLGASSEYGRIYLELGDIMYRGRGGGGDLTFTLAPKPETLWIQGDRLAELEVADDYYTEAEQLLDRGRGGTELPDAALYRRAYARYLMGRDGALIDFHRVARRRPNDYESRIALATVLLERGDYEASRSQYAKTIELLDQELSRTGGVLNPIERQGHQELLIRYIAAWNNLGVGRARSAARGGGEDDYAAALSAFTMASEYQDQVSTDMEEVISRGATGIRDVEERRTIETVGERNLLKDKTTYPYQNRLRLLGLDEGNYLIYSDIPSDLRAP